MCCETWIHKVGQKAREVKTVNVKVKSLVH